MSNRRRLERDRVGLNHEFTIGGYGVWLNVGLYEDGSPGEIFVKSTKHGSTVSGLIERWATVVSMSLQHGVPLRTLADKHIGYKFEPSGICTGSEVKTATSICDYVLQWLTLRFGRQNSVDTDRSGT